MIKITNYRKNRKKEINSIGLVIYTKLAKKIKKWKVTQIIFKL